MEEQLTIEGRIYISSKRAAEAYGYTKDYVGQMARSGRVDAKLIGRNWYVLRDDLENRKKNKRKEDTAGARTVSTGPTRQTAGMRGYEEAEGEEELNAAGLLMEELDNATYDPLTSNELNKFALTREPTVYEVARKRRHDALLAEMDVRFGEGQSLEYDDESPVFMRPEPKVQEPEPVQSIYKEDYDDLETPENVVPVRMDEIQKPHQMRIHGYQTTKAVLDALDHENLYDEYEEEKNNKNIVFSYKRYGIAFVMLMLAVLGTVALSFLEKHSFVENGEGSQQASVSTEFRFSSP